MSVAVAVDRGPFITLASGRPFYLADPKPDEVFLPDIITSMANTCRYTGQFEWSDAQHLLLCYFIEQKPEVLAHDFPEAYYGDMSKPLKTVLGEGIKPVLKKIDDAVANALGLPTHFYHLDMVKRVDSQAYWVERLVLKMPDQVNLPGFVHPDDGDVGVQACDARDVEYAEFLLKYPKPAIRGRLRGLCEALFTDERLWL